MTRDHDHVVLDNVTALRATEKALLCRIPIEVPRAGQAPRVEYREVWCPQSVISDDSEVYRRGDEGQLVVQAWWAEKEGLDG
jgi:hypothetical protein